MLEEGRKGGRGKATEGRKLMSEGTEEASEGTYWYELRIKRGDEPISIVQESGEIQYPADGNPELVILGSFALFR